MKVLKSQVKDLQKELTETKAARDAAEQKAASAGTKGPAPREKKEKGETKVVREADPAMQARMRKGSKGDCCGAF